MRGRAAEHYVAMALMKRSFAEDGGELELCHGPLTWRHSPLVLGSVQDRIEQRGGGFVAGRGRPPSGPDGAAELCIQCLDGVGRGDDRAHGI